MYSKGVGIVKSSVEDMLSLLGDVKRKHLYDKLWKCEKVLANFSDSEDDMRTIAQHVGVGNDEKLTVAEIKHAQFKSPFPMALSPVIWCHPL